MKHLFTHKFLHQFNRVREYIFLPTTATRDESFHKQVKMHLHSNRVYVWLCSKQVVSSTLNHDNTWSCMQALHEGALPTPSRGVGVPPPWVLLYRQRNRQLDAANLKSERYCESTISAIKKKGKGQPRQAHFNGAPRNKQRIVTSSCGGTARGWREGGLVNSGN